MTDQNKLSGRVLYNVRYQQMLYNEREMSRQPSKKEFAEMKQMEEEKRRFLEENSRAVREIERRKCLEADNELERIWNDNRKNHKRLLTDAREFIKMDETR